MFTRQAASVTAPAKSGMPCPSEADNLIHHSDRDSQYLANKYTERLYSAIGYITPQEAEEAFYANMNSFDKVA